MHETMTERFKPQRGKFTRKILPSSFRHCLSFKPQRGKFTHDKSKFRSFVYKVVSNPNGVNLHDKKAQRRRQSYRFKPQRGKFTPGGNSKQDFIEWMFQTPTG